MILIDGFLTVGATVLAGWEPFPWGTKGLGPVPASLESLVAIGLQWCHLDQVGRCSVCAMLWLTVMCSLRRANCALCRCLLFAVLYSGVLAVILLLKQCSISFLILLFCCALTVLCSLCCAHCAVLTVLCSL
jgi:hypothetical protein